MPNQGHPVSYDELATFSTSSDPTDRRFDRVHRHLQGGCAYCAGVLKSLRECAGVIPDALPGPDVVQWVVPQIGQPEDSHPVDCREIAKGIEFALSMGVDVIHVGIDAALETEEILELLERAENQGVRIEFSLDGDDLPSLRPSPRVHRITADPVRRAPRFANRLPRFDV